MNFKIYALDVEFYSGQDTHVRMYGRTDRLSVSLGFAPALNEPLRNNNTYQYYNCYDPECHNMAHQDSSAVQIQHVAVYIGACQAHPALVKVGPVFVLFLFLSTAKRGR